MAQEIKPRKNAKRSLIERRRLFDLLVEENDVQVEPALYDEAATQVWRKTFSKQVQGPNIEYIAGDCDATQNFAAKKSTSLARWTYMMIARTDLHYLDMIIHLDGNRFNCLYSNLQLQPRGSKNHLKPAKTKALIKKWDELSQARTEPKDERADFIHDVISYHKPDLAGLKQIQEIRNAAESMIKVIIENSPKSADQSAAIRSVRLAMMWANAAIVLKGKI